MSDSESRTDGGGPLAGRVALVTGASRGIGRAIAAYLARDGAALACVARSEAALEGTLSEIRGAGGVAEGYACDVADGEAVRGVMAAVEARFQRVDVLVNNAGITRDGLLLRMEDKDWLDVIATNLNGMFHFTKAASNLMFRNRWGRIINISSVSGHTGNPGQCNYAASKAGMIGFTKTLAKELASRNITVNAVAPGFIVTDMTNVLPDKIKDEVKKNIPARRLGNPEDIADLVRYLASPGASYLTGQVITVDGGMTC